MGTAYNLSSSGYYYNVGEYLYSVENLNQTHTAVVRPTNLSVSVEFSVSYGYLASPAKDNDPLKSKTPPPSPPRQPSPESPPQPPWTAELFNLGVKTQPPPAKKPTSPWEIFNDMSGRAPCARSVAAVALPPGTRPPPPPPSPTLNPQKSQRKIRVWQRA